MSFRYDVKPARSLRTNVFRPNQLQGEARTASLGALWLGKIEKLPESQYVDVVFEARPKNQFTAGLFVNSVTGGAEGQQDLPAKAQDGFDLFD